MTSPTLGKEGLAFLHLTREDAEAILARNHVGRLAFTLHDRVDIEPVHYVYANGWIYGRTGSGTKLTTIDQNPMVAFEVDEPDGVFDWRSVVVKGRFELIPSGETTATAHLYWSAVELLRQLIPESLTGYDRTPFRSTVFRIHLDEVTGREARSEIEVAVPTITAASTPSLASAGVAPGHGVLAAVHTDPARCQPVLRVATHLATVMHSRLTVLSVVDPAFGAPTGAAAKTTHPTNGRTPLPLTASAEVLQQTTALLERAVTQTAPEGTAIRERDAYDIRVIGGDPDYEIANATAVLTPTVLVIGRGQVGGTGKVLSVLLHGMRAARVCQASRIPVIAVADPGDGRHPLDTVVIATDLSAASWTAAMTAVRAAPSGAQIHIVRVVDKTALNPIAVPAEREAARAALATWSVSLTPILPDGAQVHPTVLEGESYEALTAFLPTVRATCVAVGGHRPRYNTIAVVGRTLPERLLAMWPGSLVLGPYTEQNNI
ncbi:MAG TPA: pyridoxamine 5'-phosphate oxidase family protein [Gemmatimonadaceae bacterium]|jgi:nitroimidazol reductase NimA-like FMN-containing flavoprotein (pyridoxamine 5'-phosphate oxidase superfamily)|nr:pyridoxamine 5'-phosphate oxidase family protein [Gemmatimonadaceae bacterium]